jgi:5-amino-6-(5-phospho-D-ribitylamino)uracil phosphatase
MKYKVLFLDLDGTMVRNAAIDLPSKRVSQAINRVKNKIHVCIATGRGLWEVENIFNHLKLTGLCILLNGVMIYDPLEKKIIKEIALKKEIIPALFQKLEKYQVKIYKFDGTPESIEDNTNNPEKIYSLWIPDLEQNLADQIKQEFQNVSQIAVHKVFNRDQNYQQFSLEITDSSATKLHAIVEIAKLLKINTEEMIGIGDSYNDFPLLMACGLKIAMGNSVPEIKAIADFIAPSVDEDGVATVIEKFVLSQ